MIHRRGFLTGVLALCTAPAIVRAGSLMPVKVPTLTLMPKWSGLIAGKEITFTLPGRAIRQRFVVTTVEESNTHVSCTLWPR